MIERLERLEGKIVVIAERSPHTPIAAAIVVAHLAVLYVLFTMGTRISSVVANLPIAVYFVSEPQEVRQWQPPEVKTVNPVITTQMPDMPLVETPAVQPSERAITVPTRPPVAAHAVPAEHSAPKLISTVEYLREPSPHYPPQSRKLKEEGLVVLRVLIDEKGAACDIEIESSSGHARLDAAAREAVAKAVFRPYVENGTPQRALVRIPIEFSLSRTTA
ncbi:MAG TPA: energy transducer TonB [Steroidobacteraceae bacterium]|jgi:protein TonB